MCIKFGLGDGSYVALGIINHQKDRNLYGQLGTREMDSSVLVPLNVQKVQNVEVVAMAAGGRHSIFTVRKTFGYGAVHDGHAYYESYSCGRADDGQLGNGTLSDQHAPSDVPAFRNKYDS